MKNIHFHFCRPLILKLCKEEAKKSDKGILLSPSSEPAGGKKKTIRETILSPPREQYGGKKTKKSSPFFKESNHDSDGDFTVESKGLASAETPRSKAQVIFCCCCDLLLMVLTAKVLTSVINHMSNIYLWKNH